MKTEKHINDSVFFFGQKKYLTFPASSDSHTSLSIFSFIIKGIEPQASLSQIRLKRKTELNVRSCSEYS